MRFLIPKQILRQGGTEEQSSLIYIGWYHKHKVTGWGGSRQAKCQPCLNDLIMQINTDITCHLDRNCNPAGSDYLSINSYVGPFTDSLR